MAGWHAADYYESAPLLNPNGPELGTVRVIGGGGYTDDEDGIRGGARDSADPETTSPRQGFRCARSGG